MHIDAGRFDPDQPLCTSMQAFACQRCGHFNEPMTNNEFGGMNDRPVDSVSRRWQPRQIMPANDGNRCTAEVQMKIDRGHNERRLSHSAHPRRTAAPDFGHRRQWVDMTHSHFWTHRIAFIGRHEDVGRGHGGWLASDKPRWTEPPRTTVTIGD